MSSEYRNVCLLPDDVANKIAAGEVVERPVSVVKELVENALDAGAQRITVEIKEGGRQLISVSDDGCGMCRADAELALQRHATSKIRTTADIGDIHTLGFRGEALPSIASVARFEMVTCERASGATTKICLDGGQALRIQDSSRAFGTTINVRNLFFCVPARAKFLKTDATEMGHIARFMQNAVLSWPRVGFRYLVDGTIVFDLPPQDASTPLLEAVNFRLRQLRGADFTNSLLPVAYFDQDSAIEGFIAPWTQHVATRQEIFFYVNQRPVRCSWLPALLKRSYGSLLATDRYPYAFLFLNIDPRTIDINIHPAKLEIRFANDRKVQDLIARGVAEALQHTTKPPTINLEVTGKATNASATSSLATSPTLQGERTSFSRATTPSMLRGQTLSVADWKKIYTNDPADNASLMQDAKEKPEAHPSLMTDAPATTLPSANSATTPETAKALAQIGGMYILAELPERGLAIIDQHAAHERINYEIALQSFAEKLAPAQTLLLPETLTFSGEQFSALQTHINELRSLGFVIEEFGLYTWKVEAVPAFLDASDLLNVLMDVARDFLTLGASTRIEEIRRRLALVLVCRKSIKFHHLLSLADQQVLLDQLFATTTPWTCPHGRPTIILLTYSELEKRFGRNGL